MGRTKEVLGLNEDELAMLLFMMSPILITYGVGIVLVIKMCWMGLI